MGYLMQLDQHYVRYAIFLSCQNIGLTAPNPSVGCVIVKDNKIIGVGKTAVGGRPHAEAVAIEMAGDNIKGATCYVSLEPCANVGKTPSCAKTLAETGIVRCVISTLDINPKTKGQGVKILQDAGIDVEVGLMQSQSDYINAGFFKTIVEKRPMFTIKMAKSLDGKIALSNGASKWITCEKSRQYGHYLRANHDAILVGAGTIRADNPLLDCRINGMETQSPIKVVLGSDIPNDSKVFKNGNETHIMNGDINDIAKKLYEMGITRVLVEGGANTITKFFNAGLVDRIACFSANKVIGGDGISSIADLGIDNMDNVLEYKNIMNKQFKNCSFSMLERL